MAGRKKADVGKTETKADAFIRLTEQRMTNALKYIGLVGNLAGPAYERTAEQAEQIVSALEGAVDGVREAFKGNKPSASGFRLTKTE
jgi:hypothetical protein